MYGTRTPAVVLRVVPSGKWFVIFMRVTLSFELPCLILRRRAAATAQLSREGGFLMWVYYSPVGTFSIKQNPDGRYGLFVGSECFGSYSTPVQAADDVYLHVTGCTEWDMLDGKVSGEPTDLSEWEKV